MKALSILQPWAWLIVYGLKDIENRDWRTHFRGRFLVHAGKRWGPEQREDLARIRKQFPALKLPDRFDLGGVVGAARIVDCVDYSPSQWFVGEYGFVLTDTRPLPFIPCPGRLGFFDICMEELSMTHAKKTYDYKCGKGHVFNTGNHEARWTTRKGQARYWCPKCLQEGRKPPRGWRRSEEPAR